MADKYDRLAILLTAKAEPSERNDVREILDVVADVLRGIEQVGGDIDRIATALEKIACRPDMG
jgi:hypothetical protein